MLPEGWTDLETLATLMVAVAQADGGPTRKELDHVNARLGALYRGASSPRCQQAIGRALEHLVLQVHPGVQHSPDEWIRWHCAQLLAHHPPEVVQALVKELARVTRADGAPSPAEVSLAANIAAALGREDLGRAMLHQFEKALARVSEWDE